MMGLGFFAHFREGARGRRLGRVQVSFANAIDLYERAIRSTRFGTYPIDRDVCAEVDYSMAGLLTLKVSGLDWTIVEGFSPFRRSQKQVREFAALINRTAALS